MVQEIGELVKVEGCFDNGLMIKRVVWSGREYKIIKLGYHHTFYRGRTLWHVYSVASDTIFLRLEMNSENLQFKLVEVADGETS